MKKLRSVTLIILFLIFTHQAFAQRPQTAIGGPLKGRLAVQLWSFRDSFKTDVPGTLNRIRELGFTHVELAGYYGMTAKQFRAELDKAGLKAVSMHIEYQVAR